jgi:5-methylthioadenosine/S-adenosylhomocysteine deaminase
VAWLYSQHMLGGLFGARDLVAMATRDAAAIIKWHKALGALEPGKRADVVVIDGKQGDPYEALIRAKETSIRLVMINGVARYGVPDVMVALGSEGQTLSVGGEKRRLFLQQATADPDVVGVSLSTARSALRAALRDLPKLARDLEKPKPKKAARAALDAPQPVVWSLALDEIQATGVDLRPRLPFNGPRDFTGPKRLAPGTAAAPLSTILQPVALDPLTVADDPDFLLKIANEPNVPGPVRAGLAQLY